MASATYTHDSDDDDMHVGDDDNEDEDDANEPSYSDGEIDAAKESEWVRVIRDDALRATDLIASLKTSVVKM
jgi:hypothetical protein